MKLQTSSDLKDLTIRHEILQQVLKASVFILGAIIIPQQEKQLTVSFSFCCCCLQLEAAFHSQGLTNTKLIWRTLRPESQPMQTGSERGL